MRITYDKSVDAAKIYLTEISPGEATRQVVVSLEHGEVVLDLNEQGTLLGIEVLDAVALLPASLLERAERLD